MTRPIDAAPMPRSFTDYDEHPSVMRVYREIDNRGGWLERLVERTWYELGSMVETPEAVPTKLTMLGGGEMGHVLNRVGLLDNFPVEDAKELALSQLGFVFTKPLTIRASRLLVRKTARGEQIALVLDSRQLPEERDTSTDAVDRTAGQALRWKYLTEMSVRIAAINPSSANVLPENLRSIGEALPTTIELGPGKILTNTEAEAAR